MARNRPLVTKRSRRLFGERLEAWDRECLARSMRHVDFIPLAGLRDFSKTMIEVLWGIGFATHTPRRRGLSAQEAKVCPELVGELAWTVFYSSWCSYPEGDGDQVSGAER